MPKTANLAAEKTKSGVSGNEVICIFQPVIPAPIRDSRSRRSVERLLREATALITLERVSVVTVSIRPLAYDLHPTRIKAYLLKNRFHIWARRVLNTELNPFFGYLFEDSKLRSVTLPRKPVNPSMLFKSL